jgi:competence protein ComEC
VGVERVAAVIEAQRPNLALWVPVLFAAGIGGYFTAPAEPETWMLAALAAVIVMGLATAVRVGPTARIGPRRMTCSRRLLSSWPVAP